MRDWWKGAINPVSVSIVLALVANATGLRQKLADAHLDLVFSLIQKLGACAVPLSLLLVGATILDFWPQLSPRQGARVMGFACVLRLAVLPLFFIAAAYFLPCPVELKRVLVVQGAMPAAMFPIILSRTHGGDPVTALRAALGTTLLSLATIPIWIAVGLKICGAAGH